MSWLKKLAPVAFVLLASLLLLTPAWSGKDNGHKEAPKDAPKKAIAVMTPTKGSKVSGMVTFTQKGNAIEITGEIVGLTPGKHGFHIHEFGDISSTDGLATGGHFNP